MKFDSNKNFILIGRTRVNLDASEEGNFTKDRYYYISDTVRDCLISNNFKSLPIDLIILIKNRKWKLIPYSKSKEIIKLIDPKLLETDWGFACLVNNKFYIFYNDELLVPVQRFTIAHEIGHISLNHFELNNDVIKEKEANMFASRLLMPMFILYECSVQNAEEIAALCNVSLTAAKYRYNRFLIVKQRQKFYVNKKEKKLKKQFKKFIRNYLKIKKSSN